MGFIDYSAAVHGVVESQTRLSNFAFTFHFHALEREMATHSSVLAWRIPGMVACWASVCGLPSMGLHRVGHDWSDLAAAQALDVLWCWFFSLWFSVLEVSIVMSSSSEILSSAMFSLLISPSKAFFISVLVFVISSISYWFFLRISICLHYPSVLACCLFFPLEPLAY